MDAIHWYGVNSSYNRVNASVFIFFFYSLRRGGKESMNIHIYICDRETRGKKLEMKKGREKEFYIR